MKWIGMEYEKQPIMKPLSKACGLLLDDEYFDDETLLTKVPSYAWYVEDKIAAFVLNAQCEIPEYGVGIRIVKYQSNCGSISFVHDMLPAVIRNISIVNEEIGHPYGYLLVEDKIVSSFL